MEGIRMPSYPGQMFDHTLDGLKGWPRPHAVDMSGTLSSNVNRGSAALPIYGGMCVHVASVTAGAPPEPVFEMGANLTKMPIFLWVGDADYDVSNPGVPAGTPLGGSGGVLGTPGAGTVPGWVPIRPSGHVMGLVAIGGYELETTEFDTDQSYSPNDPLRAVTSNTNTNAGRLTNKGNTGAGNPGYTSSAFTVYTDSTVGIVSRGSYTNKHGVQALAFWPVFLPGSR